MTRPDALARRWRLAVVLVLAGCALGPALRAHTAPVGDARHVEWPADWEGRPLRPLALSPVEERFARGFPGRIARLTDGEQVLVWRHVERPTRRRMIPNQSLIESVTKVWLAARPTPSACKK